MKQRLIEYCRFNIDYLKKAFIVKKPIIKMTERSDIHKYSIFNFQSSIPACPPLEGLSASGGLVRARV